MVMTFYLQSIGNTEMLWYMAQKFLKHILSPTLLNSTLKHEFLDGSILVRFVLL